MSLKSLVCDKHSQMVMYKEKANKLVFSTGIALQQKTAFHQAVKLTGNISEKFVTVI